MAARETVVETDRQVYQQLVNVLPWDGSISFIRTNNFAGFSFDLSRLDDLHEFEYHCKNPAFEFIDPDLEGHRAKLYGLIDAFTCTIATDTFPTNTVGRNCVPEEWENEQPERFRKVVEKLHSTAKEIVETYGSLVKTATRKLGILQPSTTVQLIERDGILWKKSAGGGFDSKPRCPNCKDNHVMGEFPPGEHLHWVCSKCNGVFDYVEPPKT